MKPSDNSFYKVLGRQIQVLRTKRELTQGALGARLEPPVTRASVANLEAGKQRLLVHTLVQIAQILDVRPTQLVPEIQVAGTDTMVATEVERELASKLDLPKGTLKRLTRRMTTTG